MAFCKQIIGKIVLKKLGISTEKSWAELGLRRAWEGF